MSSPVMNNITIFGSMLAYLTVFLQETSDHSVLVLCKVGHCSKIELLSQKYSVRKLLLIFYLNAKKRLSKCMYLL